MINDKPMLMDDYYPLPASERETPKPKLSELAMPRPKRGQLKPMDQYEQDIIARAVTFVVTMFAPGSSVRTRASGFKTQEEALAFATDDLPNHPNARCAMIYGVDEYDHHAMVCSLRQGDKKFKYCKLSYY